MNSDDNPIPTNGAITPADENSSDKNELSAEAEIFKNLPKEAKMGLEIGMMSMQGFGKISNPILKKVTEEHITKILDISEKEDQRTHEDTKALRNLILILVVIFVALFVFLTVFLVGADKDLYRDIIKIFTAFIGGLGGGFGLKGYIDRKK